MTQYLNFMDTDPTIRQPRPRSIRVVVLAKLLRGTDVKLDTVRAYREALGSTTNGPS
jgi:hypothetical protein